MKKKKVLIAVALGALVLFGLSGCGASTETATPTVTVTKVETVAPIEPAPAPATETFDVADMPDNIRAQDSWFYEVDDATIIDVATSVCTALRSGVTIEEIGAVAADSIGIEHAPALIAGAIIFICPDQKYKVGA